MNAQIKERGFTLVELVIYLVIASIAIVVVSHVWMNAAVTGADTRRRLEMSQDMQGMLFFLEDDLSRMGGKTIANEDSTQFAESGLIWNEASVRADIFMDTSASNRDLSSFKLVNNGDLDQLTFKGLVYDTTGTPVALDSVTYVVNGSQQLVRNMTRWNLTSLGNRELVTRDSAIVVAENVAIFDISAGVYGADTVGDTLFRATTPEWHSSTNSMHLALVSEVSSERSISIFLDSTVLGKYEIYRFRDSSTSNFTALDSLAVGSSYQLDLEMEVGHPIALHYNTLSPGSTLPADTLSLLVTNQSSTGITVPGIDTLYLFPTKGGEPERLSFELSPSVSVSKANLQLWMRWSFTSAGLIEGDQMANYIQLSKITLHKLNAGKYQQKATPTVSQKERSKSLDITMAVRRTDAKQGTPLLYQKFQKIVKIPNNGPTR